MSAELTLYPVPANHSEVKTIKGRDFQDCMRQLKSQSKALKGKVRTWSFTRPCGEQAFRDEPANKLWQWLPLY